MRCFAGAIMPSTSRSMLGTSNASVAARLDPAAAAVDGSFDLRGVDFRADGLAPLALPTPPLMGSRALGFLAPAPPAIRRVEPTARLVDTLGASLGSLPGPGASRPCSCSCLV